MSNLPEDYHSYNETCPRHNISYHPVDGCPACEEEPAMLKHTIPEAKSALDHLEKVRASYEHRIDVVEGYIAEFKNTVEVLLDGHADVEQMILSLDYDIDCVMNDEPPSGYHINEMYDDEFIMPDMVKCDCTICRIDATLERVQGLIDGIAALEEE